MKKLLLSFSCVVAMFALSAPNADAFILDGISYELLEDGSGVYVSKCAQTGDITVPATVKNGAVTYKVVAVGKNAFQYSEATSVTLPSTVTELMDGAFNASDIISINLGTGIEKIGENAFGFSREIEQISELPACLKEIKGGSPFNGNFKLKEIKVSPDNKWFKSVDGVLYNKKGNKLISYPYGRSTEYVIPEGVDSISSDVFNTFQEMTKITFPSTLKVVGKSAFTYCTAMVNTNDLPEGLIYVGNNAFSNCRLLNINIPSTMETISMTAFNNNWSMKAIHIPSGVKEIGQQSFNDARKCESIIIDEGVEIIKDYAFQSCSGVKDVKIPNSVTKIGNRAFSGCSGIKNLEIGSGVTTIDVAAFNNVNPDRMIVRATTPPEYTNNTYYMTGTDCLETMPIYVPDESIEAYKAAWIWKFFKNYKPLSELTSGIGDIDSDNDIVSVKYYNTQGIEVAAPEYNDGKLYIVVKRYSTGKTDTTKLLNR